MKYIFSVLVYIVSVCSTQAQQTILVDNTMPARDTEGKVVDAHDGRIIQFGNKFYWYGTAYGATNGFSTANDYMVYSSANLRNWKYEGKLLPQKPSGVYYRPHVVYNAKTKKYILWYNWYPKLWNGQFGVAESDEPTGPFTVLNDNVQVKQSKLGVGDLGVFVDDDGKAYISYNTISGHKVSVELLDDSYTASTMQGSEFIAEHCEAGSMFKRNGLYYLLTDYTCCFCTQGSGAKVFTASSPLGPYAYRQNINRHPGELAAQLNDGTKNDNWFETFTAKERNAVHIKLKKTSVLTAVNLYQFTGDRSGQCGEVDNPVLHQPIETFQFKTEIFIDGSWKEINTRPVITKTSMQTKYQFAIPATAATDLKITPLYSDSVSYIRIAEVELNIPAGQFTVFKTKQGADGKPVIPAQQTYVMELQTKKGKQWIWMGDLWGSASDGVKGHDYQFWSAPLQFFSNGLMQPISWTDKWQLTIK
jgi:Glycosyl hydrolases family 43